MKFCVFHVNTIRNYLKSLAFLVTIESSKNIHNPAIFAGLLMGKVLILLPEAFKKKIEVLLAIL
jgi:hypothetical protein